MSESEQGKYHVVLHEGPTRNDLGEMTETAMYGYVRNKLGMVAAEGVLRELEERGEAITYFENLLGGKTRIEIRRVTKR
ncbi:MAG: hypothetical protein ABSF92_03350 [Candidatus Acidiferrales bacterium]|jgi:hypothetical protein